MKVDIFGKTAHLATKDKVIGSVHHCNDLEIESSKLSIDELMFNAVCESNIVNFRKLMRRVVDNWNLYTITSLESIRDGYGREEDNYSIFFCVYERAKNMVDFDWYCIVKTILGLLYSDIGDRDNNINILIDTFNCCIDLNYEQLKELWDIASKYKLDYILIWMKERKFFERVKPKSIDIKDSSMDSIVDNNKSISYGKENTLSLLKEKERIYNSGEKRRIEVLASVYECKEEDVLKNDDKKEYCQITPTPTVKRIKKVLNSDERVINKMVNRVILDVRNRWDRFNMMKKHFNTRVCDVDGKKAVNCLARYYMRDMANDKFLLACYISARDRWVNNPYSDYLTTDDWKRINAIDSMQELKKEYSECRIRVREHMVKWKRDKDYDRTMCILNTRFRLADFEKNKETHSSMFKRLKGGAYTFECDEIFPLLSPKLLSSVFENTPNRFAKVEKKLLSGSEMMNRAVLKSYNIPLNHITYFREREGRLIFTKVVDVKEIEKIYKLILDNSDVKIPCLYSCEVCDYHHDNKAKMDKHLFSRSCKIARDLIKEKAKVEYYCEDCGSEWIDKTMYGRHRKSNKCKIKRGLMSPKVDKVYNCDLCHPIEKKEWAKAAYKAHTKTAKCKRKHKDAGLVPLKI